MSPALGGVEGSCAFNDGDRACAEEAHGAPTCKMQVRGGRVRCDLVKDKLLRKCPEDTQRHLVPAPAANSVAAQLCHSQETDSLVTGRFLTLWSTAESGTVQHTRRTQ